MHKADYVNLYITRPVEHLLQWGVFLDYPCQCILLLTIELRPSDQVLCLTQSTDAHKRVFDFVMQNGTSKSPFCTQSSTAY